MRIAIAALLAGSALIASCNQTTGAAADPKASSRYTFWRPAPVEDATEPSDVIASAPAEAWREVDPSNLLVLDLKDGNRVVIELTGDFAPIHVANIKALARAGYWNGAAIYRVQDNYVSQWGVNETEKPLPAGVVEKPPAEYHRPLAGLDVRPLGYPDSYAPSVGYVNGWPVGYDPERGSAWLTHCYGSVGVGRGLAPDTGMGGELYAVIGHAPRHLDLNIALVGRVIDGMQYLTARPRGTEALGFYKDRAQDIGIFSVRLAADMPETGRPRYEVMRTDHEVFSAYLTGRANRSNPFFERPTGGVDLCNALVPTRRKG